MDSGEIVRLEAIPAQGAAEDRRPVGQGHDGLGRSGIIMRPVLHVLFRPEEIHAASGRTPRHFSRQSLREGKIHVSYGRWWIDFEYLLVTHADADGLPAIQATGVDPDLHIRE